MAGRFLRCAVVVALVGSTAPAVADDIPSCTPPARVASIKLPDGLPPAVEKALREVTGDIALPGEDFDATDLVMTGRSWRYIFAWQSGGRWLIATEHGGIGYNDPIFVYRYEKGDQKAILLEKKTAFPPTVCQIATSLAR